MEDNSNSMEDLFEQTQQYGKNYIELFKLKLIDNWQVYFQCLFRVQILILIFSMFFLVLNIGLGFWLGEMFGHVYYGFFCLSLFYILNICLYFDI